MVTPRVVALKADLDRLVAAGRDDDLGPALEQARRAFLRAGPELLNAATPYLWQYYAATSAEGGGPLIGGARTSGTTSASPIRPRCARGAARWSPPRRTCPSRER